MKGYLYVIDDAGAEIEGSRRSLARIGSLADYQRLKRQLEAAMGEGCLVRDSVVDRDLRQV